MANPFYNSGGSPAQGSGLNSATIRSEFGAIEDGFDKLPTLSGNNSKVVRINAAGTALEADPNTYATVTQVTTAESNALAFAVALG